MEFKGYRIGLNTGDNYTMSGVVWENGMCVFEHNSTFASLEEALDHYKGAELLVPDADASDVENMIRGLLEKNIFEETIGSRSIYRVLAKQHFGEAFKVGSKHEFDYSVYQWNGKSFTLVSSQMDVWKNTSGYLTQINKRGDRFLTQTAHDDGFILDHTVQLKEEETLAYFSAAAYGEKRVPTPGEKEEDIESGYVKGMKVFRKREKKKASPFYNYG